MKIYIFVKFIQNWKHGAAYIPLRTMIVILIIYIHTFQIHMFTMKAICVYIKKTEIKGEVQVGKVNKC